MYNSEYYILELDKFFLISKLVLIFIIICYNPVYDTNRSLCNLNLECNSFDYNKFLLYTIGIYIVYTIASIHCIKNNLVPHKQNNNKFLFESTLSITIELSTKVYIKYKYIL